MDNDKIIDNLKNEKKRKLIKKCDKLKPHKILEKKMPQYIIGAFSIVAALAWNDLVKDLFKKYKSNEHTIWFKLLYSVCATLILFLVAIIVYKCNILYYFLKDKFYCKKYICSYNEFGVINILPIANGDLILHCDLYNLKQNYTYKLVFDNSKQILYFKSNDMGKITNKILITNVKIMDIVKTNIHIYEYNTYNKISAMVTTV